jgi:hypothetical protein
MSFGHCSVKFSGDYILVHKSENLYNTDVQFFLFVKISSEHTYGYVHRLYGTCMPIKVDKEQ